jgi:hypothetical protein
MLRSVKRFMPFVFICSLALVASQSLPAQEHVVSTAGLHQAVMSAAAVRKNNIHEVETFLASKPVQKVVKKSGFDLKEVRQAVPSLTDQELAQLAKTTKKAQSGFAAGALTHEQLTLIIVAGIVVIIILALKA